MLRRVVWMKLTVVSEVLTVRTSGTPITAANLPYNAVRLALIPY
jgi:hypothetical protein